MDLPYSDMLQCPKCNHQLLVERGFGQGFQPHEHEDAYDALVRMVGQDNVEVALADAYRNAHVDLMSSESRWHMILNAFRHANYRQHVPTDGSPLPQSWVSRLMVLGISLALSGLVGGVVIGIAAASLPTPASTISVNILSTAVLCIWLYQIGWHIRGFCRDSSTHLHRRLSTGRVHKYLARMLTNLDVDGITLRNAMTTAGENKWITASINPEKVLELIAHNTAAKSQTSSADSHVIVNSTTQNPPVS
ncbi:MAG: hypothetical protein KF757_12545 [Phycisphaeraceae bacterium]|nr:hypothetical protein [Phycisphaeraceae bacterium]MCW5762544.1 hypothetical protein [Phycisphaeraceae bacterium]